MGYDLFISHAESEEAEIARKLTERLEERGLTVWNRERDIHLGGVITNAINQGLASSRFGVVIISKTYLDGNAALKELSALFHRENGKDSLILPVYHGISVEEIKRDYPLLADRVGVSTDEGLDYVLNKILEAVTSREKQEELHARQAKIIADGNKQKRRRLIAITSGLFILLCAGYYWWNASNYIPTSEIEKAIEHRIRNVEADLAPPHCPSERITIDHARAYYNDFVALTGCRENEYLFKDDSPLTKGKKNVRDLGVIPYSSPNDSYGFEEYEISGVPEVEPPKSLGHRFFACYLLTNKLPVQYQIGESSQVDANHVRVRVSYVNNIRQISVTMQQSNRAGACKNSTIEYLGLKPEEIYEFERKNGAWEILQII